MSDALPPERKLHSAAEDEPTMSAPPEDGRLSTGRIGRQARVGMVGAACVAALIVGAATMASYTVGPRSPDGAMGPVADAPRASRPSPATTVPVTRSVANPTPGVDWRTSVPADFPLAPSVTDPGGDGSIEGPAGQVRMDAVTMCGSAVWRPHDLVDELAIRTDAPEHVQIRQVALFADDAAATASLSEVEAAASACTQEPDTDGDGSASSYDSSTPVWGDQAVAVTRRSTFGHEPALGIVELRWTRVGNAVVFSYETSEALSDSTVPAEEADVAMLRLVEAACVFAAPPCTRS